jgi:hypothetical protein
MDIAIARGAAFAVHDDAFLDVPRSDPRLELVVETDAHEGPVYAADEDALYFTTVPRRGPAARASTPAGSRSTGRASRSSPSG